MQTVMTALIEKIRSDFHFSSGTGDEFSSGMSWSYEQILCDAEEMIKQEREQIEMAFVAGYNTPAVREDTSEYFAATDYYNQTYGQK